MSDIRLEKLKYEFEGKTYFLECNYNVLADLQEEYGEIPNVLEGKNSMKVFTSTLAAMMNDYADTMGWSERFTGKELGRKIDTHNIPHETMVEVVKLLIGAIFVEKEKDDIDSKN